MQVSEKSKVIFLLLLIFFLAASGTLWLDYIGMINLTKFTGGLFHKESASVLYAGDDEPSLVKLEEFEKNKEQMKERVDDLDRREAMLSEEEKRVGADKEKIDEQRRGIPLARGRDLPACAFVRNRADPRA